MDLLEAKLQGHREGFIAGMKHCRGDWLVEEHLEKALNAYLHSICFDDTKPCTCGGKEDGLHSRYCQHRRI